MKWVYRHSLTSGNSTHSPRYPRTGIEGYQQVFTRWAAIRRRCHKRGSNAYHNYGARGISLSDEFHDPRTFAAYVATLPGFDNFSRLQIDRIDNDKGYERGNLRLVSRSTNNLNKRNTIYVVWKNERMSLTDFIAKYTYLHYASARIMYLKGMSLEELAKHPPGNRSIRRIERERNITFPSSRNDSP